MTGRYDIVRSLPHGAGILHSGNTGWGNAVRQCAFGRDKEQRNMEKKIYREKSMKRISSPEQLDDYIKVTGTGMWMIMGAVMLLLACVCVWGIFGHLDTVIKAPVVVKDGTLMCYIKETDREQVAVGMQVEIRGKRVQHFVRFRCAGTGLWGADALRHAYRRICRRGMGLYGCGGHRTCGRGL